MADKDKKTKNEEADTLRAGVSEEAEKIAGEESAEVAKEKATDFAVDDDDDEDDGLKTLPKGAVLEGGDTVESVNALLAVESLPPHEFADDEYFGKGGTFTIDPDTGNRVPVYEKYLNKNGKERYRPKP